MGGIDEGALDKLSLVTEMTKHIRVRSGASYCSLAATTFLASSQAIVSQMSGCVENSSEADLSSFTPAFLWLLRDFYLSLEEEGEAVSGLPADIIIIHMLPSKVL